MKHKVIRDELVALNKQGVDLLADLIGDAKSEKKPLQGMSLAGEYQNWYTRASVLVKTLAPDRHAEFVAYYLPDPKRKSISVLTYRICDFVNGITPVADYSGRLPYDPHSVVVSCLHSQVAILNSISSRIDGALADLENRVAAELQESGIAAARQLKPISLRAAGALAGVVIEDHLQRVAKARQVEIKKRDPTIAELNDPLKAAGVIDTPTWRRIQFLADIRNLCAHKKSDEPTPQQIDDMISGAAWVVANVS